MQTCGKRYSCMLEEMQEDIGGKDILPSIAIMYVVAH
jgi:hypothetical protein